MRTWLLAAGLILIVAGLTCVGLYNLPANVESRTEWIEIKSVTDSMSLFGSALDEGETVKLDVQPPLLVSNQWLLEEPVDDVPLMHVFVYINITDPSGKLLLWYELAFADVTEGAPLVVYKVSVLGGDKSSVLVLRQETQTEKAVVFDVLRGGVYNAKVIAFLPQINTTPPSSLSFLKEVTSTSTEDPYSGYLYPGVAMLLAGVFASIWSFRSSSSRARNRRLAR